MKIRTRHSYIFEPGEVPRFLAARGDVTIAPKDDTFFLHIDGRDLDYWISELIRVKAKLDKEVA